MAWHWLEPQMISIVSTFLCIISDRSFRHAGDQWSCSDHSNSVARDACDIQLLGRHGLRTSVPWQHFWSMFLTSSNFKTSARMCQGMLCALQILVQWFWPYTIMNLSFQDSESSCDSRCSCSNRPWTPGSYHTRHRQVSRRCCSLQYRDNNKQDNNTSQARWRISDPSWDELLWCTFVKAREIRLESLRVENSCLSWWRKGNGLQRCRGGKRLIVWYCCGRLPWISLQCAWQGSDSRLHKVPAETVEKL